MSTAGPDRADLHVLRLCSVFESDAADLGPGAAEYDPVGGMQNHTAALSRCLDDRGVRQTIVTSRLAGRAGRTPLGRHGSVVRVGVAVPWLRQLWGVGALRHVLRPTAPVDVVHAHQGEDLATLLLARLAARVHRCALVVTVHCSVRHTLRGTTLRARLLQSVGGAVERRVLRRAEVVVALAERTAALLRGDGLPADRVRTIPSGVEPQLFPRVLPDAFGDLPRPRVGYVGRLVPQKRPDLAVGALERMRSPAHLVVVGDGPVRPALERRAAASAAPDRISFHGLVPHAEIPAVLSSLDVLVLPSAYEELGSVLVEAMAAGLPVVATRVGGIPEVVADGVTGLLVPAGDATALAGALDRLLGDPALTARLGRCARERSGAYAWPVLAGRIADLYRALQARRPQPGPGPPAGCLRSGPAPGP
jgi:glycogen(starch) synthase